MLDGNWVHQRACPLVVSQVDDLEMVSQRLIASSSTEKLPTFIGGQSMGGLIASYAVLRNQGAYSGLILHSAAIDVEWTFILRCQVRCRSLKHLES